MDLNDVVGLPKRQSKQYAGLPWQQIVGGDETALAQSRAANDTAGSDPAAKTHQDVVLHAGLVEGRIFLRRRPAGAGRSADDAPAPAFEAASIMVPSALTYESTTSTRGKESAERTSNSDSVVCFRSGRW